MNMNMGKKILDQQLVDMHKQFENLDKNDYEGKVNNIKQRIFLMHKIISGDVESPIVVKNNSVQKDTRSEMDDLRSKLMPKKTKSLPFNQKDMEDKKSDEELKRALNKAFDSM